MSRGPEMPARPRTGGDEGADGHSQRVLAARSLLRSLLVSGLIVVGYFTLPFSSSLSSSTVLALVLGLAAVTGLLLWQLREIVRSPYPRARAVGALATSLPLFLVVFATVYYLMGQADAGNWSQHLSRLDALYFTVTVFATVGFGDITAVSEAARAVTTLQMVGDVVLVGLVAHVVLGAMQEGLRRRAGEREQP